jgi:hypothetical protein
MAHEELDTAIAALGLTYTAHFVQQSQSRNATDIRRYSDLSLNWKIRISKNRQVIETDYMQGIAHVPGYNEYGRDTVPKFDALKFAAETGKAVPPSRIHTYWGHSAGKPIPAPLLRDVLHSLVLDAGAIDYACFEDWASEYGYETDSIKALRMYETCRDIGLKLRTMLGSAGIAALQTAFQDY